MKMIFFFLITQLPFLLEMAVGTLIFSTRFYRRNRFGLRCALALLIELALFIVCYLWLAVSSVWLISNTLYYLLLFCISLLLPFFCFRETPAALVLSTACGYTLQHLGSQFSQLLWPNLHQYGHFDQLSWSLLFFASQVLIYVPIFLAAYLLISRTDKRVVASELVNRRRFFLSLITVLLVIVLSSVRDTFAQESFVLTLVTRIFSMFCCVFLLLLRAGILERSQWEEERELLLRLHGIQLEQYEQQKEVIELISIKCHDLRHRMEVWEQQGGLVTPEELRETRQLTNIYDSSVKTGNDTLDTLLTQHSLTCDRLGIRLSCIVDGKQLSFLPVGDICSLFGNALENAIEAVSRLERPEERIISLNVQGRRGMVVITVENPFTGPLRFSGDLPCTSKEAGADHGFGLKSIRLVAERHGGELAVSADELFHLCVLLPLPQQTG